MNKFIFAAAVISLACATTACSKKDMTPGEVVKTFLNDFATDDIDGASALADTEMKVRFLKNPALTKAAFKERRLMIEKCGGYKDITSRYNVTPDQTTVEGFSLLEYKGTCPAQKQYMRLKKNEGSWFVDEFGPLVKP